MSRLSVDYMVTRGKRICNVIGKMCYLQTSPLS
jgi:hypothetical protein